MMNYKWYLMVLGHHMMILAGTWAVKVGTAWYYMVQGQQRAFMPIYTGKKWRFGQVLLMPDTHTQSTEYRATQLV